MTWLKRHLIWLDDNLEKIVIVTAYAVMAGILIVAVARRYLIGAQWPWTTSLPIYLFFWVTWFGAAYNVRMRSHLNFGELRTRFPYPAQFACQVLDAVLWVSFAMIVIYFTWGQVEIAQRNRALVTGTDHVLIWWFYMCGPIAWTLIVYRALRNLWDDWIAFRRGEPFAASFDLSKS